MIFLKIEKIVKKLFWLPLVLGMVGYCLIAHIPFMESLYASAALYFVNPVVDDTNGWILAAEILAILVTTGVILSLIGNIWDRLRKTLINRQADSVCIYCDAPAGEKLAQTVPHGYLCRDAAGKKEFASHDHIFMLEDEKESLQIIARHQNELRGRNVFVELKETDPYLLAGTKKQDIHFFSVPELMARTYWKQYPLLKEIAEEKKEIQIAILFYDALGRALFRYGYLYNLYSPDQKIHYHLWGCDTLQGEFLASLSTENADTVTVHTAGWKEDIALLQKMDRVILTDISSTGLIQELLYRNRDLPIHYYAKERTGLDHLLAGSAIAEFGASGDVLTVENIRKEKLYRQAKLFHYDYVLRKSHRSCPAQYEEEMEEAWKDLDGFMKGSNIARADHYRIEVLLEKTGMEEEKLRELEHIRWCRFLRINHRNEHPLLIPYRELAPEERKKDGICDPVIRKEIDSLN